MKILALGDVFGRGAVEYLSLHVRAAAREEGADIIIANCENASGANGAEPEDARALLSCGCDVLTGGNHTFGRRAFAEFLEREERVLRPANYPAGTPGAGYTVLRAPQGERTLVISVRGELGFSVPLASPFETVERILDREKGGYDIAVADIHAEMTSEKLAFAAYFDGRLAAVFGTHTHVPTADARVLPRGTGYITDLGMCGPTDGILGVRADIAVSAMRNKMPAHFETAEGKILAQGAVFDIDSSSGLCTAVKRVEF